MTTHIDREFSGEICRTKRRLYSETERHNYVGMEGRVTVTELLAYLAEHAPDTHLDQVFLNWTTVVWVNEATAVELAEQEARAVARAAKLKEYELSELLRLTVKYLAPLPDRYGAPDAE